MVLHMHRPELDEERLSNDEKLLARVSEMEAYPALHIATSLVF